MKNITLLIATFLAFSLTADGQGISSPPSGANQKASVTQYIGSIVHVSVHYNSPDVTGPNGEDRTGTIWGQLVPYGMNDLGFGLRNPSPWRAGANENTTITFSHDVEVEGKPLEAGTYGLHLIVQETGPWTWIFSRNSTAWGSYFYDESEDALRVEVVPSEAGFHEWLTYEFTERQPESCELSLFWENIRVPMHISVPNINELYVQTFERELQGAAGFNYQNWMAASAFCAQNNVALDKGLEWADAAISAPFIGVREWNTLSNKAMVLNALGKNEEADAILRDAMELPSTTPLQIHQYGRQLITAGNPKRAMEVFEYNYDRFDGAWPTNLGMARGLSAMGDYEKALKYAESALALAPDDLNRNNIMGAIEKLKQKQDIN